MFSLLKKHCRIPLALFCLTFLITLYCGIKQSIAFYSLPISTNASFLSFIYRNPRTVFWGLSYSLSLMSILLFHEMGHYFACRRHHIESTLPFFLPAPDAISLSGTFGAFIKIQSPITSRKSLFDIGVSGPIAGFVLALPIIVVGIHQSKIIDRTQLQNGITLGEPLLFSLMARLIKGAIPATKEILLHPVAFAGWFGLLATSYNLLPVGQLDGGHILHSLLGKKSYPFGIATTLILLVMGIFLWPGWLVWALLISLIGFKHPPIFEEEAMDPRRKALSIIPILIFLLSFTPVPLRIP